GFQWFAKSAYWVASGGKQMVEFYMPVSDTLAQNKLNAPAIDILWERMTKEYPSAEVLEVHVPEDNISAIEVAANPDDQTYWKADYRYFDQHTLEEIQVTHMFGQLKNTSAADKLARMNYDLHVGAVWGLPGKILAFIASLICASLPITGIYIWWGRRKKEKELLAAPLAVPKESDRLSVKRSKAIVR
ncbi:MAG TPA: PepSY-associated TM helix domain-containing protein, partial [Cyclobacteriaceae bacterium]